jgi:hypothetical protein
MTSLRLPTDVEQKIFSFARTRNQTKSAVILTALERFFEQEEEAADSFRIGKDRFGRFGSGTAAPSYTEAGGSEPGNLSTAYKKLMRGKILAKYRSR